MRGSIGRDGVDCNSNGSRNREAVNRHVERRAIDVEGVGGSKMNQMRGSIGRDGVDCNTNGSRNREVVNRLVERRALDGKGVGGSTMR